MGDGNIQWKAEEKKIDSKNNVEDESPRPLMEKNFASKESNPPIFPPLEIQELHRNANNAVNTPEISSASIESPATCKVTTPNSTPRRRNTQATDFGLPLGPAAGLGPQEASEANTEIFSVGGTRSVKINRHRDSVTVFPSGCMGIKDRDEDSEMGKIPEPESKPEVEIPSPKPEVESASPSVLLRRPNSAARNPLTGEGYENATASTKKNFCKRPDGNPLMGTGYEDVKSYKHSKVPPGGFSKGLW